MIIIIIIIYNDDDDDGVIIIMMMMIMTIIMIMQISFTKYSLTPTISSTRCSLLEMYTNALYVFIQ